MDTARYTDIEYTAIHALCTEIFKRHGFSPNDAKGITEVLLKADLFGIESHGVQRMIRYHNAMLDGEVDINSIPETVHETPISATIEAHKAMGQVIGSRAMELAIKKAETCGIGMVAVRGSNHYGIAGYYSLMAARQDLIGVCMTNTEAIMVPTFGRKAVLGTNPIAVAMPADPVTFSFDAATTVVPRGKLEVYNKRGDPLPSGWALDAAGNDCAEADTVLHNIIGKLGGGIAPLGGIGEETGGYKGYGFGMVCELFTSIMAGGPPSNRCVSKTMNSISHCFWAIDYGIFGQKKEIRANFSRLLNDLREAPKAEGRERIYIHGEKEFESEKEKLAKGIPMNEKTFAELREIAGSLGIDAGAYIGKEFIRG